MSIDAKANTLPKWSYILLAALLVPFGVGLIWAIVSKGQCSGCGDSDRGRMFFHGNRAYRTSRLAETQHVARPSGRIRPVFHIVPLPSRVRRNRSGSLRVRHGVHELLTLALMANLAYKDEGWRKGMLDSEKAFRLGRPLLMFYRLFLAFGILAEIVPGMAALISDNSGILISMFMTTYPVTLWNKFTDIDGNLAEKQADGTTETKNHENHEGTRRETSIYVRKDILRYRR